jgi:transposase
VGFLSRFITGSERLLIDLTHIFSLSEGISMNERGYNSRLEFMPQVNLLFLFSYDKQLPLYYRLLPGNVRDVSSLGITLLEIDIEDAIIIGDKGFYSDNNRRLLEDGVFVLSYR